MRISRRRMGALVLFGGIAAAVCACRKPSGDEQRGGKAPALWEPIDKEFKGCEGG